MSHPYMHPNLDDPQLREQVQAKRASALRLLEEAVAEWGNVVFASSLGAEDQVVIDLVAKSPFRDQVAPFVLDTGRLPEETYATLAKTEAHYGLRFAVYSPEAADVERVVCRYGINGFYHSLEARHACCEARKVLPLKRALAGQKAWITGLRRQQNVTRAQLEPKAWDEAHGLWKISPLWDWTHEEVWAYIRLYQVPYHPLHDAFYPSIGCAPCTRAVAVGEDPRAGRWWWEHAETRECGLHRRDPVAVVER